MSAFRPLSLAFLFLLAACGGNDGGSSGVDRSCGPNTCDAGQYCASPTFGTCENGCLANSDCEVDQTCDLGDGSPGVCQNDGGNGGGGGGGGGGTENLSTCQDACDDLGFFCDDEGADDPEVTACAQACNAASPQGRLDIASCIDLPTNDCNIAMTCY